MTAATLHADSFANTPSGYLLGIGLPIVSAVFGAMFTRYAREQRRVWQHLTELKDSQAAQTQALALLVQQATDDRVVINRVPTLEQAMAVLQDRVDRHESWALSEANRIRDGGALAGLRPRPH